MALIVQLMESLWQRKKEVILKSILTVATGALLVAASGVSACSVFGCKS